MRAKIMMLPGSAQGRVLCASVSRALSDVAVAFDHTFVMREEKIGEESAHAYDAPFTVEAGEACLACDAVMLGENDCAGAAELYQALGACCRVRVFDCPEALSGLSVYQSGARPSGAVVQALRLDRQTIDDAAKRAFTLAQKRGLPLRALTLAGGAKAEWDAAFCAMCEAFPDVEADTQSPEQAFADIALYPDTLNITLCPPAVGALLLSMCASLHGARQMLFDVFMGGRVPLYAPIAPKRVPGDDAVNPLGAMRACALLLSNALHLERESDCVRAAVDNVLLAGWRTQDIAQSGSPSIGTQAVCNLISEQIALAGEFLKSR